MTQPSPLETIDLSKTYVYEDTEVQLTGRVATRQIRENKVLNLVEITPLDSLVGKWKKWIDPKLLFEIN